MLTRYLLTLGALMLLAVAVLVVFIPLLLVRTQIDGDIFAMALGLWTALASGVVLVGGNLLLRRIWFFRGTGEPVAMEVLRARLLALNELACPVMASAKRGTMVITWRYTDAQWCELFSRMGLGRLYELRCRIDADSRTVYLLDRIRTADFVVCPDRVKIGWPRIPLPLLRARSKRLGTIEQYASQEAHDYHFHPREIKSPVLGTLLASGWNVRFSLW